MKLPFKMSRVYILSWLNKLLFYPGSCQSTEALVNSEVITSYSLLLQFAGQALLRCTTAATVCCVKRTNGVLSTLKRREKEKTGHLCVRLVICFYWTDTVVMVTHPVCVFWLRRRE